MPENHRLKDGRTLNLRIARSVPKQDQEKLRLLLSHKGAYRNHIEDFWKNGSKGKIEGLEWRFYLASLGKKLVANICVWEANGIAILGHVYTHPDYRRLGVANALLQFQDKDFWDRGGRAIQLRTDFGTPPYRMYIKLGYRDISGNEGMMVKLKKPNVWEDLYRSKQNRAAPFHWRHWPSANLLFLTENPSFIRCHGYERYGVDSLETPVAIHFPLQKEELERGRDQIEVLEGEASVCVAWASVMKDPNWKGHSKQRVFDLFFHPAYAKSLDRLIRRFSIPPGTLAYSTDKDPKNRILADMGFHEKGTRKRFFENGQSLIVFER
ncbi:MAG: GNAT family N-acetyltransferase [Candidatus Omnitrophica bacterium]|nr:GNAT family N-acetyltransferase [Candidatus Omnitrophota bacterium]